ncbi:hypothetical protein MIND_00779000 [Mycena indigotica]|uniref:MYND-type domain-containing protein n=1 Tax=Mycena indigotica TaxID=2126181 RepID=A0A8H6SNN1_9AGAR|nr:uncharacterized protein MIND_00779000 [Mycena indigotica]KAF7302122.1 hypothetical protein MIND_00779000 [Mycena indigotica]
MPTTIAMGDEFCFYCENPGPLRKCARCEIARYCSQECQKKDWKPTHKAVCFNRKERLSDPTNPLLDQYMKDYIKWNKTWQDPILAWGLLAANLANQPEDYLTNHTYYVILKRRSQTKGHIPAPARFEVTMGGMRHDSEIIEEYRAIPNAEYSQSLLRDFKKAPRANNCIRCVVALPACAVFGNTANLVENLAANMGISSAALTDPCSGEARLFMSTQRVSSRRQSKGKNRADLGGGFRAASGASWEQNTNGLGLYGTNPLDDSHMQRSFSLGQAGTPNLTSTTTHTYLPPRPQSQASAATSVDHARSSALASIARPGHFHRAPVSTRTPYTSPVVGGGLPSLSGRAGSHSSLVSSAYTYSPRSRQGYSPSDQFGSGYASSRGIRSRGPGSLGGYGSMSMSSLGSGFSSLSRFTNGTGTGSSLAAVGSYESGQDGYGYFSGQSRDSASPGWSTQRHGDLVRPSSRYSTIPRDRGRRPIYGDREDDMNSLNYALAGLNVSSRSRHLPAIRPSRGNDFHSGPTFVVEPSDAGSDADYEEDEYYSRHRHERGSYDSGSGFSDSAYTDEYEADYDYDDDDEFSGGGYDEYSDDLV